MKNLIKDYLKNGFMIKQSLINKEYCLKIKNYLNKQPAKINVPFSKIPWGYGNLLSKKIFNNVIENPFLRNFCLNVFKEPYDYNHLTINNKAALIGSAVEWHQEIFNINTYAPGYGPKDYNKFMQIFIALDDQDSKNGCLKIIPKSHSYGKVKYEDIVGDNFGHKRRVEYKTLKKIVNTNGILDVPMKAGDALFFNHLIIHGSPTNYSNTSRKSIVLQARIKDFKKKDNIFIKETKFRKNFVTNHFKNKINSLNKKNIYKDFN